VNANPAIVVLHCTGSYDSGILLQSEQRRPSHHSSYVISASEWTTTISAKDTKNTHVVVSARTVTVYFAEAILTDRSRSRLCGNFGLLLCISSAGKPRACWQTVELAFQASTRQNAYSVTSSEQPFGISSDPAAASRLVGAPW